MVGALALGASASEAAALIASDDDEAFDPEPVPEALVRNYELYRSLYATLKAFRSSEGFGARVPGGKGTRAPER